MMKYTFEDVVMLPAAVSHVGSPDKCNVRDENGMLPLITAPMSSVVDGRNIGIFTKSGVYGIYPSGEDVENPIDNTFSACGLDAFTGKYLDGGHIGMEGCHRIMIDEGNGHSAKLHNAIEKARGIYSRDELVIMAGNAASSDAFVKLSYAGADYVRCGACNMDVSFHYPLCSLIDECYNAKESRDLVTKIVADAEFRDFNGIVKALGLGADLVMLGGIFNKALESAAATKLVDGIVDQYSAVARTMFEGGLCMSKEYTGLTEGRALESGRPFVRTSGGAGIVNNVEYTLDPLIKDFTRYLRSVMSYAGTLTLDSFIGGVDFCIVSPAAHRDYIDYSF